MIDKIYLLVYIQPLHCRPDVRAAMYLGATLARLCPPGAGPPGSALVRRQDWVPALLSVSQSHYKCDNSSYSRTLPRKQLLDTQHRSSFLAPIRNLKIASQLVDRSPSQLQPFLKLSRLDKPIGSWLLFWPCGWSTCLATQAGHLPDVKVHQQYITINFASM